MDRISETQDKDVCSVCGFVVTANYCGHCGQRKTRKPVTIRSMLNDLAVNLFNLERSVFLVAMRLTYNPAKVVRTYWQGDKGYYPSPGKMLFFALTAAGLYLAFIDSRLLGLTLEQNTFSIQLSFLILFFPLFFLASRLTYFREKRNARHLVSVIYLGSAWLLVLLPLHALFLRDAGFPYSAILFGIGVCTLSGRVFKSEKPVITQFGYGILNTLLFFVLLAALLALGYYTQ